MSTVSLEKEVGSIFPWRKTEPSMRHRGHERNSATACWYLRGKLSFAGVVPSGTARTSFVFLLACSAMLCKDTQLFSTTGTLASPGHVQSCLGPDSIFWGCTKPGRLGPAKVKCPDFRGCCMRPLPHGGSASLRPCCQGLSLHCPARTTRCARLPAPTISHYSVEGLSPQPHPSRVPQGTEAPHPHSPRGRQSSQVGRPHAGVSVNTRGTLTGCPGTAGLW